MRQLKNKKRQYQFFAGCFAFLSFKAVDSLIDFNEVKGRARSEFTPYVGYYDIEGRKWPLAVLRQVLAAMNKVVEAVTETRDLLKIAVDNYSVYYNGGIEAIRELQKLEK